MPQLHPALRLSHCYAVMKNALKSRHRCVYSPERGWGTTKSSPSSERAASGRYLSGARPPAAARGRRHAEDHLVHITTGSHVAQNLPVPADRVTAPSGAAPPDEPAGGEKGRRPRDQSDHRPRPVEVRPDRNPFRAGPAGRAVPAEVRDSDAERRVQQRRVVEQLDRVTVRSGTLRGYRSGACGDCDPHRRRSSG